MVWAYIITPIYKRIECGKTVSLAFPTLHISYTIWQCSLQSLWTEYYALLLTIIHFITTSLVTFINMSMQYQQISICFNISFNFEIPRCRYIQPVSPTCLAVHFCISGYHRVFVPVCRLTTNTKSSCASYIPGTSKYYDKNYKIKETKICV